MLEFNVIKNRARLLWRPTDSKADDRIGASRVQRDATQATARVAVRGVPDLGRA